MKFKLIRIPLGCIVATCYLSCFHTDCINLFFAKNETYWTNAYEKGDTLIFSSFNNPKGVKHTDTIFILDKKHSIPKGNCNPIEVSNYDSESYHIDYSYKHDTILSDNDYLVQHVKENKGTSIPVLRVYGLEYSGETLKDTTITLNTMNIRLDDCYTFQKQDCYNSLPPFRIKTFVWSKKMGLVMFISEGGEKFELIKKINVNIKSK